MHQVRPFTQKREIQDNLKLEVAAKRLFPQGYGDGHSAAALGLKAWETFRMLNIGHQENPPMPVGDVAPSRCPRAQYHSQAPETFPGYPVVTSRAAETTCRSQVNSSESVAADRKLQEKLVVQLPKMGEEKLKSISSMGSARQLRTSTPVESARPRSAKEEQMKVDTFAVQTTSQSAPAGAVTHPVTQGQALHKRKPNQLVDAHARMRKLNSAPKTNRASMTSSRVFFVSQEDWEQSLRTNYRVEPLPPPMWVVHPPPGRHLATMEEASVDEWRAEPNVTLDQLHRQLTKLATGTS